MNTCLFCDSEIPVSWRTCRKHFTFFLEHEHEPWCQELVSMQRVQTYINQRECFSTEEATKYYQTDTKLGSKIGRPRRLDFDRIIELRRSGVPFRKIAQEMKCHERSVIWVVKRYAPKLIKKRNN